MSHTRCCADTLPGGDPDQTLPPADDAAPEAAPETAPAPSEDDAGVDDGPAVA